MTKVCSFCNVATINESESVCNACMKKYDMGTFDNSRDGCGCDCWEEVEEEEENSQNRYRYRIDNKKVQT